MEQHNTQNKKNTWYWRNRDSILAKKREARKGAEGEKIREKDRELYWRIPTRKNRQRRELLDIKKQEQEENLNLSVIWSTMDDYLTHLDLIDSEFDWTPYSRIQKHIDTTDLTLFLTIDDVQSIYKTTVGCSWEDWAATLPEGVDPDLTCRFAEFPENIDWTYSYPRVNGSINRLPFNVMLSHVVKWHDDNQTVYDFEFGKLTEYSILPHLDRNAVDISHRCHDTACFNKRHLMWEAHNVNMGRNGCPSELGCLGHVVDGVRLPDCIFN